MTSLPDILSVVLRSASFVAILQAAGMSIFLALFGNLLDVSGVSVGRIAQRSAVAAMALLVLHYGLEAARMAGSMSGILEPSLQMMVMRSTASAVLALRLWGLALITVTIGVPSDLGTTASVIGAVTIAASFMLTGHTSVDPLRWALAPLLMTHILIVAFWFGALVPLFSATALEYPSVAGLIAERFSRVALWLVPVIFIAGLAMALILIRDVAAVATGYGLSLVGKFAGFAVLMGLAAWNKWRLVPLLRGGDDRARQVFRRSLAIEYALLAAVLSITAVMTTFYSPET